MYVYCVYLSLSSRVISANGLKKSRSKCRYKRLYCVLCEVSSQFNLTNRSSSWWMLVYIVKQIGNKCVLRSPLLYAVNPITFIKWWTRLSESTFKCIVKINRHIVYCLCNIYTTAFPVKRLNYRTQNICIWSIYLSLTRFSELLVPIRIYLVEGCC